MGKPSHEEAVLSRETLQMTETEICGICFIEEDKESGTDLDWVSCSNCLMWVHTACAPTGDTTLDCLL